MTAGTTGTAPLFLAAAGGVADGSWWLPDLRAHLRADRLLDREITRRLTRCPRYSGDTLFAGVHVLTERASATITGQEVGIVYPPAAVHVAHARQLREDVDPVQALDALLHELVTRPPALPAGQAGVEISGGADSANVALTVSAVHHSVTSYGIVVDGEGGRRQRQRRAHLIRHLGTRDLPIAGTDHLPFAPVGTRATGTPHPPGEYYLEAFDAAQHAAADAGVRVLFTGIGGDELLALHATERQPSPPAPSAPPPWLGPRARAAIGDLDTNLAPAAPTHLATLTALATRNPPLLARGIWPVSPLADPKLVRFGESLPLAWRRDKRLARDRLRRAGLPEHVTHPPRHHRETFSGLMQAGLRRHGLPLLEGMPGSSILVDGGYLDPAALRAAAEHARSATVIPSLLYDTIALETSLQSLC